MFKTLEEAKMYMPPEIYEFIQHLDVEVYKITRQDNNGDNWHIVKGNIGINIFYRGKPVEKLNWYERLKVMLSV